ncbi:MAG: hypothetical protein AAFV43_05920 [Planctomycetota bacterium]
MSEPGDYTLIVLANEQGDYDVAASVDVARRSLGRCRPVEVVPLEEHEVGAWIARHRGRRCRTERQVLTITERSRPVVIDADLPSNAWRQG